MTASFLSIPPDSPFPLANLPYGSFSVDGDRPRLGVALGDKILDLAALGRRGLLEDRDRALQEPDLRGVFARTRPGWRELREEILALLVDSSSTDAVTAALIPIAAARMHLPFEVADYVDFYSFLAHAENLGHILRPDSPGVGANWRHLPIGYHGRAGTVAISGTAVTRPCGQRKDPALAEPSFGPSERLDIEAEVGFVVGVGSPRCEPLAPGDFAEHVFGVVLVNDWSARDIQAYEYVPLGPFLGKSFLTSISPWVVTLDALAAARVEPPAQSPAPSHHLIDSDPWALDLELEVRVNGHLVSRPPFREMYWTPGQQLAHLTSNGASSRAGDLFASGTVSGRRPDQLGSLIELTWNATRPLRLGADDMVGFLSDGDTVTITARAPALGGGRLGFGTVTGTVYPTTA